MLTKIVIVAVVGLAGVATGDNVDLDMNFISQGYFNLDVAEHSSIMKLFSIGGAEWISSITTGLVNEYFENAADLKRVPFSSLMRESKLDSKAKTLRGLQVEDMSEDLEEEIAIGGSRKEYECQHCVEENTKSFVEFAAAKTLRECQEKPLCQIVEDLCSVFEDRPDYLRGYLWARMQPLLIGFAFCFGAGKCEAPTIDKMPLPTDKKFNPEHIGTLVSEHMILAHLSASPRQESQNSSEMVSAKRNPSKVPEGNSEERRLQDDQQDVTMEYLKMAGSSCKLPPPACVDCIHRTTIKVVDYAANALQARCVNPHGQGMRDFCQWMKDNFVMVMGFLIGRTEAWKYGAGMCLGTNDCPPPRPPMLDAGVSFAM